MIGRTIGTYRIQSLLGQGGMGAVYRGVDLMLDRPVAIKALRADIAASPDHVERFRQEAKTLARLLDPHIATLYALLRDGDDLYMVMEFVEGETFEALLHRERRLPASRALDLFRQALRGIDHAHQRGIVHRDVKPANFMITPSGTVKVMDFGIARLLGTARMTQTAHAIGTAEYMAPEQVRAREVDARTDVYALGVLLYEMVAGRVPFDEPSAFEIMQAHLQREPTPPSHIAGDLPPAVESAILTALAKDPDDRFPTVAAFRDALPPLADAPPTASTPPVVKPTVAAPVQPEEPRTEDRGPLAEEASTDNAPAEEASPGVSEESPNLSRVASADEGPAGVSADGSVPATPPTSVPLAIADSVAEAGPSADTGRQPTEVLDLLRQTDEEEAPPALAADVIDDPEATVEIGRSAPPPTVVAPAGTPPTVAARSPAPATVVAASPADLSDNEPRARRPASLFAVGALVLGLLAAVAVWTLRSPAEPPTEAETAAVANERDATLGNAGPGTDIGLTVPLATEAAPADGAPQGETRPEAPAGDPASPVTEAAQTDARAPARAPSADPPPRQLPTSQAPVVEPAPAAPQVGTARVIVRPFGDVYVDGRRLARGTNAPVSAELAPGTYTVRATHPTFGELTRSVRVRPGRVSEVLLEFATPVEVTVTSEPINAEILLDGRRTGRYTPATITVPPGTHTVGAERDGFSPASRSITVRSGQSAPRIHLTLSER